MMELCQNSILTDFQLDSEGVSEFDEILGACK